MLIRSSGLLLHLTSLPSPFGIGDLGPGAHAFAAFLARAGQSVWQILPVDPTAVTSYNDPYHSVGALAGNPLLISPEALVDDGLLDPDDIASPPDFPTDRVDYEAVTAYKDGLFKIAHARFAASQAPAEIMADYRAFRLANASWLDDFALYMALREDRGGPWPSWPEPLRDRDPEALEQARRDLAQSVDRAVFLQWIFQRQWDALHARCRELGVRIFGDMPVYVDHDSVDCWSAPGCFKLDGDGMPTAVSGVPPDYFSATGQLWGTPVYDWDAMERRGFDWWLARVERNLALFDMLRIDHFRGLVAYWEVPAGEDTAMNGQWVEAPVERFMTALTRRFPCLPIVAEDLGVITPDVRETMARFKLPGMKILLFAFGSDLPTNPYAPHNMVQDCVVYTGTHDNNPVLGWWDQEATADDKARFLAYLGAHLGREVPRGAVPWEMVRLAMLSTAALAVVPVQDLLGLGAEARMNRPGNLAGNWTWRLEPGAVDGLAEKLAELTCLTNRS